ncbi:hypothetical protein CEXT_499841 [Caerostris extrusa]|uniref:Uncharacterized protein n=1 Tax=Caerostris extrusa TaxID=172846 RepID=A0AAV4MV27_CAEEX|nr:hypothetical protein CEXT_499841 [Caerostris extrusa]
MEGKKKRKKTTQKKTNRRKRKKNPITMSFLAFNVGLETSNNRKQFSPLAFQSENETCATTLRRTHSWRSFHYLMGAVIERNKGRWENARPDMIQKIRAPLRLGHRRFPANRGASSESRWC